MKQKIFVHSFFLSFQYSFIHSFIHCIEWGGGGGGWVGLLDFHDVDDGAIHSEIQ